VGRSGIILTAMVSDLAGSMALRKAGPYSGLPLAKSEARKPTCYDGLIAWR